MSRTASATLLERELNRLHRRIMTGLDSLAASSDRAVEASMYLQEVAKEYAQGGDEGKAGEQNATE